MFGFCLAGFKGWLLDFFPGTEANGGRRTLNFLRARISQLEIVTHLEKVAVDTVGGQNASWYVVCAISRPTGSVYLFRGRHWATRTC